MQVTASNMYQNLFKVVYFALDQYQRHHWGDERL